MSMKFCDKINSETFKQVVNKKIVKFKLHRDNLGLGVLLVFLRRSIVFFINFSLLITQVVRGELCIHSVGFYLHFISFSLRNYSNIALFFQM